MLPKITNEIATNYLNRWTNAFGDESEVGDRNIRDMILLVHDNMEANNPVLADMIDWFITNISQDEQDPFFMGMLTMYNILQTAGEVQELSEVG